MAAGLALRPDMLAQRRNSVEHPFGTIKQWMGQGAFLMRRLENVRGAFSLTALTADQIALGERLIGEGRSVREAAKLLKCHHATFYRALSAPVTRNSATASPSAVTGM
jgi:hypothetical protein